MDNNMLQDKIRGSLLGGAIGDALGYQIEFAHGMREKQVTRFRGDIGVISDDTQMTLFTAIALLWQKTQLSENKIEMLPAEAVYHGYLDWFDAQEGYPNHKSISWIKNIPELNRMRAPGNTCLRSLHSRKMGTIENRINDSKGCGSVMRIAPCSFVTNTAIEAAHLATECGAITHGHTLALMPCFVAASVIYSIVFDNADIHTALHAAMVELKTSKKMFQDSPMYFRNSNMTIFSDLINKAVELSKKNIPDTQAIRQLGEGWTAEEALAIALYSCLKYPNSFEDAVVCAVNHDGDSDSTGAIAGNIIGASLGYNQIPTHYTDNVELKDVVLEIADDLSALRTDKYAMRTEAWHNKYTKYQLQN